jgi:hypothetical protein
MVQQIQTVAAQLFIMPNHFGVIAYSRRAEMLRHTVSYWSDYTTIQTSAQRCRLVPMRYVIIVPGNPPTMSRHHRPISLPSVSRRK